MQVPKTTDFETTPTTMTPTPKRISTIPQKEMTKEKAQSSGGKHLVQVDSKEEYEKHFSQSVWLKIILENLQFENGLNEDDSIKYFIEEGLLQHFSTEEKQNYQKVLISDRLAKVQYTNEVEKFNDNLDKHKKVIRIILDGLSENIQEKVTIWTNEEKKGNVFTVKKLLSFLSNYFSSITQSECGNVIQWENKWNRLNLSQTKNGEPDTGKPAIMKFVNDISKVSSHLTRKLQKLKRY